MGYSVYPCMGIFLLDLCEVCLKGEKMKIRFEYCGNTDCVTVHVTEPLLEQELGFVSSSVEGESADNKLLALLKNIPGAEDVSIRKYSTTVTKGLAFSRDEVLESTLTALLYWFSAKGVDISNVQRLSLLREDIRQIKCRDCQAEMNAEMERSWKDLDTLYTD